MSELKSCAPSEGAFGHLMRKSIHTKWTGHLMMSRDANAERSCVKMQQKSEILGAAVKVTTSERRPRGHEAGCLLRQDDEFQKESYRPKRFEPNGVKNPL